MAPHSSTLAWKNPMDGGSWWAAVHGVAKSRTWLSDFTFTFHFHALEKEMASHSSVLAWRIPGMGDPGGLLSMGSHRVGHDWSDLAAVAAYIYPLPPQAPCLWLPPSHPSGSSQSTELSFLCFPAVLTGYLSYTWQCTYVSHIICSTLPVPSSVSTYPFSMSASLFLPWN